MFLLLYISGNQEKDEVLLMKAYFGALDSPMDGEMDPQEVMESIPQIRMIYAIFSMKTLHFQGCWSNKDTANDKKFE